MMASMRRCDLSTSSLQERKFMILSLRQLLVPDQVGDLYDNLYLLKLKNRRERNFLLNYKLTSLRRLKINHQDSPKVLHLEDLIQSAYPRLKSRQSKF